MTKLVILILSTLLLIGCQAEQKQLVSNNKIKWLVIAQHLKKSHPDWPTVDEIAAELSYQAYVLRLEE